MTDRFNNTGKHKYNSGQQDDFSSVKHSVSHKKRERKLRKKRKKLTQLKSFLKFVVVVILIVLSYMIIKMPQWYLPVDAFNHPEKNIEIVNNKIIPDYVIYDSIKGLKTQQLPIFLIKTKPVMQRIYKIPVIKKAYIRRYGFPARLQIIIRERTPIAILKPDLKKPPIAFFTSDGVLVTNKRYMNIPDENILKIITTPKDLNKKITAKKIQEIERVVKAVETYSNEKVEYIDIRKSNDVFVKIHTINIRLGVLDSTVYERIKRIYTILPQISNVDSRIKYIDLSWDKVNYLKLQKVK